MKKFIFLLLIIIVLVGNFFLRHAHIQAIESSMNNMQKTLSDYGVTLGISKITTIGNVFWNIECQSEIELYTTFGDSILYFYIPDIKIYSSINILRDIDIDMVFPQKITGHLDLNPEVAKKLTLDKKYLLFLESTNIPIAHIKKKNFIEDSILVLDLEKVLIDYNSGKLRERFIFIDNIHMQNDTLSTNQSKLNIAVQNLNIYLDQERFARYLPDTISFDDASKDIDWELNLFTRDMPMTDGNMEKIYNGNMDCITKVFEIRVDGEDRVLQSRSDKDKHKSDLNFKIKNFDVLIDYWTALVKYNKKTEIEQSQLQEISNVFRKNIKDNIKNNKDMVSFKIKDTDDNQTLFEGIPIHNVFKDTIDKLYEYN